MKRVAGVVLNKSGDHVAMADRTPLSLPSGVCEGSENANAAMARAFEGLTGLRISTWSQFCTVTSGDDSLVLFKVVLDHDSLSGIKSADVRGFGPDVSQYVKWIVQMALDKTIVNSMVIENGRGAVSRL